MQILNTENLTLADFLAGDRPQMPSRTQVGTVRWYDVASLSGTKINYGDFQIRKGEMYIGVNNRVFIADSNGIRLGHELWGSAPFRVDMSGNAFLSNAEITGKIDATSGTIGGFTITPSQLYGGTLKTSAAVGAGGGGVVMDSNGLRGYDPVLGNTFNLPVDGSPPTFSSGVIQDVTYNLTSQSVIRTSDTVGDGTANSAGVLINNAGIFVAAANQTLSSANVRILATGEAVFSGSVKGGMTDYLEGEGYFMGLSGGSYKLSVGDPGGNYMAWDDEQLMIKGVIELDGPLNLQAYATVDLPIAPTSVGLTLAGDFE